MKRVEIIARARDLAKSMQIKSVPLPGPGRPLNLFSFAVYQQVTDAIAFPGHRDMATPLSSGLRRTINGNV